MLSSAAFQIAESRGNGKVRWARCLLAIAHTHALTLLRGLTVQSGCERYARVCQYSALPEYANFLTVCEQLRGADQQGCLLRPGFRQASKTLPLC